MKQFETVYGKLETFKDLFINAHGIDATIDFTNEPEIEDDVIELEDGWSMQVGPYGLAINLWDEADKSSRSWDLETDTPVREAVIIMGRVGRVSTPAH